MKIIIFTFLLALGFFAEAQQAPPAGNAVVNKKMDLGDIAIKGELLGDDRMNFVKRQREELKNRVKFRTNFRAEILQEYKK